jgi:hypothetical protein
MITRNKIAEQVLEYVKTRRDRDQREVLDIREVFLRMDEVANGYARIGRLEMTREGVEDISACYLTTFPKVKVIKDDSRGSHIKLPSRYINISRGRGVTIYDSKTGKLLVPVTRSSVQAYANSGAAGMQGRPTYYLEGEYAVFGQDMLKGPKVMPEVDVVMALVDVADIEDDVSYPIDMGIVGDFVAEVAGFFLAQPATQVPETKQQ